MQPLSMRPPLAQSSMQSGLFPKVEEGQVSIVPQNSLARNQFSSPIQLPMPPRVQLPQPVSEHALQQASLPGHSLVSSFTPPHPHSSSSLSIRPQIQVAKSSINQQLQPPQLKNLIQVGAANLGHSTQMVHPNATIQPSTLSHHSSQDAGYKVPCFVFFFLLIHI